MVYAGNGLQRIEEKSFEDTMTNALKEGESSESNSNNNSVFKGTRKNSSMEFNL